VVVVVAAECCLGYIMDKGWSPGGGWCGEEGRGVRFEEREERWWGGMPCGGGEELVEASRLEAVSDTHT